MNTNYYSQICVNFRIIGKNGDERANEENTRYKGKARML